MAASRRVILRHLFSGILRVRPVQVKALPSNLSFSTKTRSLGLLALSALTTIYVNFRAHLTTFVDDANLGRCKPSRDVAERLSDQVCTPSCYLRQMTFVNNKTARPTKSRKLFDMHDMPTYGIHYVGQVAYAQKSNQHGEVIVLYEGVITLVP